MPSKTKGFKIEKTVYELRKGKIYPIIKLTDGRIFDFYSNITPKDLVDFSQEENTGQVIILNPYHESLRTQQILIETMGWLSVYRLATLETVKKHYGNFLKKETLDLFGKNN